jgi:hypothetical protein
MHTLQKIAMRGTPTGKVSVSSTFIVFPQPTDVLYERRQGFLPIFALYRDKRDSKCHKLIVTNPSSCGQYLFKSPETL